ncbi:prenyltransferase [Clostridium algoriphilum]|uniref:prenyltransferase n=1 Tax=Clostridium algoriphilum TaxID=198347 RepID=UPI001CF3EC5F|nr:prenyltransferase [Clostridium algoriphilum]MCB2294759.1 prenyltransferase [Clostridium algoriphilum]
MINKVFKSTRPATLVVSILSTFLGIIIAYRQGYVFTYHMWDLWRIFLVIAAAVLLQAGMNMMNNYFEDDIQEESDGLRNLNFLGRTRSHLEILIFKVGITFFAITALISIYLAFYTGFQLLIIELIGIFAAYAYAGEPINYKKYRLGSVVSFIMMGPLMAYASFFVFSKSFSLQPIVYSFTLGLFIPAILLANELRDYFDDKDRGVLTLTVRIGYEKGKIIYYSLIAFAYINTTILVILKYLPEISIIVLSTIPLINEIVRCIKSDKRKLVPITAMIYLFSSIELFLVLILTK